ncbi:MAG: hypothetical protein WDN47_00840 [Candidatus Doudnabacteria bacterium]
MVKTVKLQIAKTVVCNLEQLSRHVSLQLNDEKNLLNIISCCRAARTLGETTVPVDELPWWEVTYEDPEV